MHRRIPTIWMYRQNAYQPSVLPERLLLFVLFEERDRHLLVEGLVVMVEQDSGKLACFYDD